MLNGLPPHLLKECLVLLLFLVNIRQALRCNSDSSLKIVPGAQTGEWFWPKVRKGKSFREGGGRQVRMRANARVNERDAYSQPGVYGIRELVKSLYFRTR